MTPRVAHWDILDDSLVLQYAQGMRGGGGLTSGILEMTCDKI